MRPARSSFFALSQFVVAGVALVMLITLLSTAGWADTVPSFVARWGSRGSAIGELRDPLGIATDSEGNVFVADRGNHRIQKFSGSGAFLASWSGAGRPGTPTTLVPNDVALDGTGNAYVADGSTGAIVILSNTLSYQSEWPAAAFTQITIDPANQYLYGTYGPAVYRYTLTGTFVHNWNTGSVPSTDVNWGIGCGPSRDVYVAMYRPNVMTRFAYDGTPISQWGSIGSGAGQFISPFGVAVSQSETIYVSDSQSRVQMFTQSGVFIASFGSEGSGDGEFISAVDLSIDENGSLYVLDAVNCTVQKFVGGITPTRHRSWGALKSRYRDR